MNEAETRAEYIDPNLKASGWGVVEGSKVLREYKITAGKIQTGGGRAKPLIADYVLVYQGRKLAVIESKSDEFEVGEGVAQAKIYAGMMHLDTTYASNGKEIYQICMKTGKEGLITAFPSPDELWNKTFAVQNQWRDKFNQVPFEDVGGTRLRATIRKSPSTILWPPSRKENSVFCSPWRPVPAKPLLLFRLPGNSFKLVGT